jgi:glycerol-3-phosphate acyltransferase PlsY
VALVVLAVVIARHQANIRRMIRGEESRLRRR